MRRSLIPWAVAFGVLIVAFVATVVVLNSTLYSANGFVRGYLDALARQDSSAALEVSGVSANQSEPDDALLTDSALGELGDIRLISDTAKGEGQRSVVFEYTIANAGGSETGRSEFTVARDGTRFGLFSRWTFVTSPLNTVSVTVLHDTRFAVNGHTETSSAGPNGSSDYLVFSPGLYTLDHETAFLAAKPVTVAVTDIGEVTAATVDVQANHEFVAKLQVELDRFLDTCSTQTVLLPTGCPFGREVSNRITTEPAWSIVDYPAAEIVPGELPGTWAMPATEGTANIVVEVQSLFDGTLDVLDEDVPFTVEYLITFEGGTRLVITAVP